MPKLSVYCSDSCGECRFYIWFYCMGTEIHHGDGITFRGSTGFFCSPGSKIIRKGSTFEITTPCKTINPKLPLTYHLFYSGEGSIHPNYTRKLKHFYEDFSRNNYGMYLNDSFAIPSLWKRKNFKLWARTWLKLVDDSERCLLRLCYFNQLQKLTGVLSML